MFDKVLCALNKELTEAIPQGIKLLTESDLRSMIDGDIITISAQHPMSIEGFRPPSEYFIVDMYQFTLDIIETGYSLKVQLAEEDDVKTSVISKPNASKESELLDKITAALDTHLKIKVLPQVELDKENLGRWLLNLNLNRNGVTGILNPEIVLMGLLSHNVDMGILPFNLTLNQRSPSMVDIKLVFSEWKPKDTPNTLHFSAVFKDEGMTELASVNALCLKESPSAKAPEVSKELGVTITEHKYVDIPYDYDNLLTENILTYFKPDDIFLLLSLYPKQLFAHAAYGKQFEVMMIQNAQLIMDAVRNNKKPTLRENDLGVSITGFNGNRACVIKVTEERAVIGITELD